MAPLMFDMGSTGFYMFPYHEKAKIIKIGHHGDGYPLSEPATRETLSQLAESVRAKEEAKFYTALKEFLPNFERDWKVDDFHMCQYCDSKDSNFVLDYVRPKLIVAAGGSGHGAKFGPLIGKLVVRLIQGRFADSDELLDRALERFRISKERFSKERYEMGRVSEDPKMSRL